MSRRWLPACIAVGLCLLPGACGSLPEIGSNVCGNGVIEAPESCDGFARGDAPCRPPGSLLACHLDCSARSDGPRPQCPAGWGCALDDVCRRATGEYRAPTTSSGGDARSLFAGDFDGDGRGDVVSLGAPASLGVAKLRVHYFDRDGTLARTWSSLRSPISLAIAQVSDDPRDDLVFAALRIGLLLGQADRSLISGTYPTYFLPHAKVRIVAPLRDDDVGNSSPLLVLTERDGALILSLPSLKTMSLAEVARFDGQLDDLAGEPAIAHVFEDDTHDPCRDLALALRGAHELTLFSVCDRDPDSGDVRWSDVARTTQVVLDPPSAIEAGPLLADMNGDGHIDVLVAAEGQLFIGLGDGTQVAPAKPMIPQLDGMDAPSLGLPLAAGDFTGDGIADLVYPQALLLSQRKPGSSALGYHPAGGPIGGAAWSIARIADLNGNGKPDVIAASNVGVDIDFFNGTGSDRLTPFVIPASHPVDQLSVGDLDGDLINDLVFTQTGVQSDTDVSVAFGNVAGPPATPVTAARAPGILQVGTLPHPDPDGSGELFLAYQQPGDDGELGSAMAWFVGNGDRGLMCYIELTTFASDMSLRSVPSLGVTTGAFTRPGQVDALLISSDLQMPAAAFWMVPDLQSQRGRPQLLGWDFDTDISPVTVFDTPDREAQVELRMAAGDLDGDQVDELVIAAPDAAGEHCLLTSAHLLDGALVPGPVTALEPVCSHESQLQLMDLDGDQAAEVVLLTGPATGPRRLLLLWNDGAGGLSPADMSSLAADEELPRAFVLFRPTPDAPVALAYVTEHGLRVLHAQAGGRGFEHDASELPFELADGTGITATDVDGDGVTDLVVADAGSVRVLRAELAP